MNPPPNPIVFRCPLTLFAHLITSDHWVLDIVHQGYLTEFLSFSPCHPPVELSGDSSQYHLLQEEACALLHKGAIESVPLHYHGHGFYSPYFLVPKKGGGVRPILDLQLLN